MGPFVCSCSQRSYTEVKDHQRSSCKMGSKYNIHFIWKVEVRLEPNWVYWYNVRIFTCTRGQRSQIKVKGHVRSTCKIAWKCKIWLTYLFIIFTWKIIVKKHIVHVLLSHWLVIAQAENHETPSDDLYGTAVLIFCCWDILKFDLRWSLTLTYDLWPCQQVKFPMLHLWPKFCFNFSNKAKFHISSRLRHSVIQQRSHKTLCCAVGDNRVGDNSKTRSKLLINIHHYGNFCEQFLHNMNKKKLMRFHFLTYAEF